jgi:DNA repair protein RadA/Sms
MPMTKKNSKVLYTCQTCGFQTPKWMGKCPDCGEWDTLVEEVRSAAVLRRATTGRTTGASKPVPINAVELAEEPRVATHIKEFDRVLGGGLVQGSLVLIGGDPGIGKSTLMLQALNAIATAGRKVLYVSGEESVKQLRIRSQRLAAGSANLLVVSEIDLDAILAMVNETAPDVLVIDSIQTMFSADLTSAPGSVGQVRESTMRLMLMAKNSGVPTFLVGHVTKEGVIAGPRLLEHMVDTVLYFEGDRNHVFRILRAVKNRFGSTNEIGVFEMKSEGLAEVANPSALFLSERPENVSGSVVTACMEGSRPILVEFQALASSTNLGTPRRTVLGFDQNRVALLVAVMEKKLGLHLTGHDIFMNVAGGVRIIEPAADLAVMGAIASSFLDKPIDAGTIAIGEVGLTGEVRAVGNMEIRLGEAAKMGFSRCLAPAINVERLTPKQGIEVVPVRTVDEAMDQLF